MKERLFVATFSENAVSEIRNFGLNIEFDHLCISENLNEENIKHTIWEMKKDWTDSKAKRAIIHGPYTELNPSSIDPKAVKLTRDRYEEAYSVCKNLGISRMILHSGFIPNLYYEEWHKEKSITFWKEYIRTKPENFRLYIENVFEDEPHLLKNIIEAVGDRRVKICLDIGHVNVFSNKNYDILYWIQELGNMIEHVHIHNNYGFKDEHSSIFQGNMDMEKVIEAIDKYCGNKVTLTIESRTCYNDILWFTEKI